jgi:hypothetical protein
MLAEAVGSIQAWPVEFGEGDRTPATVGPEFEWASEGPNTTPIAGLTSSSLYRHAGYFFGGYKTFVPWRFQLLDDSRALVSSVGLGSIAAGLALGSAGAIWSDVTDVLPAPRVLVLINPGQLLLETTSLHEEPNSIRLISPGLRPRVLRVGQPLTEPPLKHLDPKAADALAAVRDLTNWLGRTDDEVAEICRYSLRASKYWARGKVPRPSTVRRLFETHALLSSLVRKLGRSGARQWMEEPTATGSTRLEALSLEDGMTSVVREASKVLFTSQRREVPRSESVESAAASEVADAYAPDDFIGEVRRPRKPPDA